VCGKYQVRTPTTLPSVKGFVAFLEPLQANGRIIPPYRLRPLPSKCLCIYVSLFLHYILYRKFGGIAYFVCSANFYTAEKFE
jgi:hypothetical protein